MMALVRLLILLTALTAVLAGNGSQAAAKRVSVQQVSLLWFGPQRIISAEAYGALCVVAADIDGDGDIDAVGALANDNAVVWYENLDGQGNFGPARIISTQAASVIIVYASDLDGDGDPDVLSASVGDDKVAWYENLDGKGNFGPQQVISTEGAGAYWVVTGDLDGDDDPDVVLASLHDGEVSWFENLHPVGVFGPQQVVSAPGEGASSVATADIDGDGDLDILATSFYAHTVSWYENLDGQGSFGPQRLIATAVEGAASAVAGDFDGDGDMDVASAALIGDRLAWYENVDGVGNFGPERVVSSQVRGSMIVAAADLDGDGDLELISGSQGDGKVAWFENVGGAPVFGPEQIITLEAAGVYFVAAADVNGDGRLDVFSASWGDHKVAWYENLALTRHFLLPVIAH